jgi:simple sugar transport system ATP-binding protein
MTGWGIFSRFDVASADKIVIGELAGIGIDIRDPSQTVGTLSGGERQCLAIARAVYFGARVLILDEPTSALGVHQASIVLKYVALARKRGLGVIFISHNIHHAFAVADRFTLLNRGTSQGTYKRGEIERDQVLHVMAGGETLEKIEEEVDSMKERR